MITAATTPTSVLTAIAVAAQQRINAGNPTSGIGTTTLNWNTNSNVGTNTGSPRVTYNGAGSILAASGLAVAAFTDFPVTII